MTLTHKIKMASVIIPTIVQTPFILDTMSRTGDSFITRIALLPFAIVLSLISTIVFLQLIVLYFSRNINSPILSQEETEEGGVRGGTYPREGVGVEASPTEKVEQFSITNYPKKIQGKIKAYRTAYKVCIDNNINPETDYRTLPEGKARNRLVNYNNMAKTISMLDINPESLVTDLNQ